MRLLALRQAGLTEAADRPVSFFEFWPGWLFYAPIVAQWIALGLRYRSMSLPTAADPAIEVGGLCGESKSAILDAAGPEARALIVPYTCIETGEDDLARAEAVLDSAGIGYPLVAKPDIGCNGTGVRLIADPSQLSRYLAAFPRGCRVVLQEFAPEEGEAGLFYLRAPGTAVGRITSMTFKHAPFVTGDGRSTLRALILADARFGRVPHLYFPRLAGRLEQVPLQGERVRLVFVGNHCKGSIFEDATHEVTPTLTAAIERVARDLPEFHFGRIDVRFASPVLLRRGKGFRIIEVNGAGSEATHIWDPATSLWSAWRAQFFHYGMAFKIGAANRARGHCPVGIGGMWRAWRRQKQLMASYPLND